MFQPRKALRAYHPHMNEKDLAAALAGAEALDLHVRRKLEALGGDLTGTVYDVDPALRGREHAAAVMAKAREAMDRNAGTAKAAEVARASAEAASSGAKVARAVEDIFDGEEPLGM